MNQLHPIQPTERIELLDIIRGIALLGILLVNMSIFSQPIIYLTLAQIDWWTDSLNQTVVWLITFLAEGKFYPMFSFLFGLGFMLFINKAEQKGFNASRLYRRRAFILLGIGLIHAVFIWMGDILVTYALLSLLLLVFRDKNPKTILKWALGVLLIPALLFAVLLGLAPSEAPVEHSDLAQADPFLQGYEELASLAVDIYATGTYTEILSFRINELLFMYVNSIVSLPTILGMFLLGIYLVRIDFFQQAATFTRKLRQVWLLGLLIGVPLSAAYASLPDLPWLEVIGILIGGPAMTIFYLVSLYLLYERTAFKKALQLLAPVGRLGLTNYLSQSLICTTIFYSYGFGLYGSVSPFVTVILAVVIYGVQVLFSHLWLKRYSFGPVEWLWRKLTYRASAKLKVEKGA